MEFSIIERVTRFTPLGLRFWDAAFGKPVADGMAAVARPWGRPGARPVRAIRGPSGVLSFHGLPGLRALENDGPDATSPPPGGRLLVELADTKARYAPVAFGVDLPLPYRGPYVGVPAPVPPPAGFLLLSGPTRRPEPGFAHVIGTLARAATGAPVAWAVVTLTDPDGGTWQGLSGPDGRFAIVMPWPALSGISQTAVPPTGGASSLSRQTWPISVGIRAAAAPLPEITASELPDYAAVTTQPTIQIWPAPPGFVPAPVPAPTLTATLSFGAKLILQSGDDARLLVGDPPS